MNTEHRILETKLDILIKDFQRFRTNQEQVNKDIATHANEEDAVQAKILTTLKWHSVIGSGMLVSLGVLWLKVMGA